MVDQLRSGPAARRRSPLSHLADAFAGADVTGPRGAALREVPFQTMVGLRAAPGSASATALGDVLGAPLPGRVGQTSVSGDHATLWLAPDEWLVVSGAEPEPLVGALAEALGQARGAVVDLSANRTVLELTGPAARAVLEKGCPADLHPRVFGTGSAIATTLGPVPLVLWRSGEECYRLLPRASFADYVARWLLDAMAELGLPEVS